ncbi:MAG: type II toxin-antitoxin system VapC family toxin [Candidatus Binatia bacterium]
MVLDTSALLAILLDEPERHRFIELIASAETRLLSAASLVEASIVLETRRGEAAVGELDLFLQKAGVEIVPVNAEQAELARDGYREYGKGRHVAALNLGDCFAYALAKAAGEPLLFKGTDFSSTDVSVVKTEPRSADEGPIERKDDRNGPDDSDLGR